MSEAETVGHFGSWAWDVTADRLWWSQGTYRIFGLDPQQFRPSYRAYLERVHPADRDFVDRSVRATLDEGHPYRLDHRILRPDGTVRWIQAQGNVFRDGEKVQMIGTGVDVTEARLAQEEAGRLAGIVSASPDAILSFTAEGEIMTWNPGAEALYGRRHDAVLGQSIASLFAPDSPHDHHWLLEQLHTGGRIARVELRQQTAAGRPFFASVAASAYADRSGVTGGAMIVRDITAAKAMEQALRDREAEYRRIAETAQEGVWVIDAGGRTIFANQAMAAMLGTTREAMLGTSIFDFAPPEARAVAEANLQRRRGGVAERHPFTLRRIDGSLIHTEMAASPIFDGGQFVGALAMVTDVSEHVRQEAERERLIGELAAERNWLQATIENSTAGIVLAKATNPDCVICNPRTIEIFGFTPGHERPVSEFEGRLYDPAGKPIPAVPLRDGVLHGERIVAREYLVRRTDGAMLSCVLSAAPVYSSTGQLIGAVGVFDDVTAMKQLQRLREEWTSIIAHDLRQPLTTLLMKVEVLRSKARSTANEEIDAASGSIETTARQLARLIQDLTDASLLDSNRFTLAKRPADPAVLLRDIASRVAAVAEKHPIVLDLPPRTTLISIDAQRIEQVLVNLIENADKYGYAGAPIRLRLTQSGAASRIDVINEGDGIPPEEVAMVFDRYRRARAAETGGRSGLGLGLYIAKGIIESHGGRLTVESIPKTVTTFSFEIPAAMA